jgi:hypothetical protein
MERIEGDGWREAVGRYKTQAYGFRNHEFLVLKLYALRESRYALVG